MSKADINMQLEQDDKKYIWHPFTQMKDYAKEPPLIIEKGKGSFLFDINGNKYLDGISSLWVTTHGHRKKEIDDAISEQLKKISHTTLLGLSHPKAIELAKRLVNITPLGLEKIFYSESGSTAVEIALKIAFQYWTQAGKRSVTKTKFISLTNAYHGDTIGSVSVGGMDLFHQTYRPLLFETIKAEPVYCYRCSLGKTQASCSLECLTQLEETIKKHHKETVGLIIEPMVQGAAGMLVYPSGYLKGVRSLCTKYDILMIADEVAVGFGRTGRMFACEHENVLPDIMTIGKGLTGGYLPLAATLTTQKIYNAFLGEFDEFKTFFHGHTYTGNPLGCAAAIANLNIFEKEKTIETLAEKIAVFKNRLQDFYKLAHVGDVRQFGLMAGIELVAKKDTKSAYEPADKIGIKVIMAARKRGVILRPLGDVIVLMPPLSISIDEIAQLLDVTFDSIKSITR